jgi:pimeloyl-ACP methyl ester carboxylesterase
LFASCRVITPDLRGSGRSQFAGALSWDLLADDIAALARQLGLARAVVGGISAGSACAVRVALRHPSLVAALAVVHPAFGGTDVGLAPAQQQAMAAMAAAGRRALAEGMTALDPLLATLPEALRARTGDGRTYDPRRRGDDRVLATGAQPFTSASEARRDHAPVLIVPGIDAQHPVAIAERMREHLPRCTYVATADIGRALADFVATAI